MNNFSQVYNRNNFNKALNILNKQYETLQQENHTLHEKINDYESKINADTRVIQLNNKLKQYQQMLQRGFPITAEEEKDIKIWQRQHEKAHHGNKGDTIIGSRYTYVFVPTSLGIIGTVQCTCGAAYTFSDIE